MSRYHHTSYGGGAAPSNSYNRNTSQQYYGNKKPGNVQLSSRELQIFKSSFSVFDLDSSGKISKNEFKSTLQCLGFTASDEEIESILHTYDSNGDGMMDLKEFITMVKHLKSEGRQYGRQALEKEMKNAFSVLDADGDGYLTVSELSYVLCNVGNRLNPAELEDFVKLFDKDKDGRISCQELIAIMCSSVEDFIQQLIP